MNRLLAYSFIFTLSLSAYMHDGWGLFDREFGTTISGDYELTFNDTVGEWAEEISDSTPSVQVTEDTSGNCLPVAVELQKRIVATGRSALIVAVDVPDLDTGHALVLYTSEPGGRFDYVIDNGFSTAWVAQPRTLLDRGVFGTYYATCKDPVPSKGYCGHLGAPF